MPLEHVAHFRNHAQSVHGTVSLWLDDTSQLILSHFVSAQKSFLLIFCSVKGPRPVFVKNERRGGGYASSAPAKLYLCH
jgi:hypothetical protein